MAHNLPRRPLRVLITTPNLDTAGSKYILADLIRGLDRSAVRPSLCVHRRTHTELELEIAEIVDELIELPLRLPTRPLTSFWQRTRAIANQLKGRFDIIHSFDYASNWQEGLIAHSSRIPWLVVKTNISWNRNWWLKSLLAQRIVTYSHPQYEQLYKNTIFAWKTNVVHPGIDLTRFQKASPSATEVIRRELALPIDSVVLVCVAHLVPVKGHIELIKAFAQVGQKRRDLYLVLIGGGESAYETKLAKSVADLGVRDRVRFLGIRLDVGHLLPAFDGLILATRNWGRKEAFGVALIEAMACGLPVIATRSGGPEDIVVPGETGWIVDAEGEVPLVNAMIEFLDNPDQRIRFGEAGRQRAEQFFSRDRMVDNYQKMYLSLQ